ncbi:putative ATP-dependent helicase IRC5 [Gossypium arboreum]|nr:putative ATP-dependent helicase IRC5 [Gossypium arboreum]
MSDVLKRRTSVHWSKKQQSSFKSVKKKIQGATNEIRNVASLLGEGFEVVNPKELYNLLKEEQDWASMDNAKYSKESGSNNGEKREDCICYK